MIVVTGPEHSGTGLVARIVKTGFPEALHWAMPHINGEGTELWWSAHSFEEPPTYVVVTRDRVYRNMSTTERGFSYRQAENRYNMAIRKLSALSPAYWISVEALVLDSLTQVKNLSYYLGRGLQIPEHIYDLNERFRHA